MNLMQSNLRRLVASSLFVAAIGGAISMTSITAPAQAESTQPRSNDQGVWMVVTHKVVDYKLWKPVHERSVANKQKYGWSKGAVFSVDGDKNHVMVMEQFASIERARAYADSTELRDEMATSGVSSNSEIRFVKNLSGELVP